MFAETLFPSVESEAQLLCIAIELGAIDVGGPLTAAERDLAAAASSAFVPAPALLNAFRIAILEGADPLGEELCRLRSPVKRRSMGAFYTPPELVNPMVDWVLAKRPGRVVDAGCGSGRFSLAVARVAPNLQLIAVDLDPVATLLTRAALAVAGCSSAKVLQHSYTTLKLDRISSRTAFVGNPPYVRHHGLTQSQKAWAARAGFTLGCRVSGLSGLHVHFYLATALHARLGDVGCFVTSAEWLDVGYGAAVRDLLLHRLGGQALHLVDSRAVPFGDAQATAIVACFEIGSAPKALRVRLEHSLGQMEQLDLGQPLPRESLEDAERWSPLFKGGNGTVAVDQVALGSIARVHRGIVTGSNSFFVLPRERARALGLESWCRPAITAAQEILSSGGVVVDGPERKLLLDVPASVDRCAHPTLDAYLKLGEARSGSLAAVADGYICRHRKPWWSLGRHEPPPIVVSYMARQAPAFALNPDGLALINIAHGIYPIRPVDPIGLAKLASHLNQSRQCFRGRGRTYQGGLEKFEPREIEALPVRWPVAG